jgi:GH25 family lysozyme M1 (1,4-beta-N-acetylmuramidase)
MRARLILAGLLALALGTACGGPGDGLSGLEQGLSVCPAGETLPGIDVSYWQQTIDWDAVAGDGYHFAIARISDGTYMDTQFDRNWTEIRRVGMVRGAYQFYEPTVDSNTQADIVVNAVGWLGEGDLPVTLDVEWTDGTPNAGDIGEWVARVRAGTGKTPMIYTALGYWDQYFSTEFGELPLWVANWDVNCPNLPSSWSNWVFWQTGGGPVAGISGNVDQDLFNGGRGGLDYLAAVDEANGCNLAQAWACAQFGCGCADAQCSGTFCDGTGCNATLIDNCGAFGCNCVDGKCAGGFCPGAGCTVKETNDCAGFGCPCVDHQCSGGFCPGAGCTAKEAGDCAAFGCGCVDHACSGGACEGTGCTARQASDCEAAGQTCLGGVCQGGPDGDDGGGGDADDGGQVEDDGGQVEDDGGQVDDDAGQTADDGGQVEDGADAAGGDDGGMTDDHGADQGGADEPGEGPQGGCGCASATPEGLGLGLGLGLLFFVRTRRRGRGAAHRRAA